jgi:hypothetical protein
MKTSILHSHQINIENIMSSKRQLLTRLLLLFIVSIFLNNKTSLAQTGTQTNGTTNGLVDIMNIKLLHVKADGSFTEVDGARAKFGANYSAAVDSNDAIKWSSAGIENLGLSRDGKLLSIEARPYIIDFDSLFINTTGLVSNENYRLKLTAINFDASVASCKLYDRYLNTETAISLNNTTLADFNVSTIAGSNASNRFFLKFLSTASLPINYIDVKAYKQSSNIMVSWTNENLQSAFQYSVEKSIDGLIFSKMNGTILSSKDINYNKFTIIDNSPKKGMNYYRVVGQASNNILVYSAIVKIEFNSVNNAGFTVYPNPFKGTMINLLTNNLESGVYTAVLLSQSGKQLWKTDLNINSSAGSNKLSFGKSLANGLYQLQIISKEGINYQQSILILE